MTTNLLKTSSHKRADNERPNNERERDIGNGNSGDNHNDNHNIVSLADKAPAMPFMDKSVFPPLPKRLFAIIYADPPWDYKGQLQHAGKGSGDSGGAIRHYPTLTLKELKTLNILSIAENDCLLFMWATSPHLDQAIELGKAWGFDWATIAFIWHKGKPNPGFYTMSENELCLVFKKGKIPTPRGARNIRQTINAPRDKHSRKPEEARKRIDLMFPQHKKIELFARKKIKGWALWGNEIDPLFEEKSSRRKSR